MRTTLDIDDEALRAARALAAADGVSLGAAVSELVRRGLVPPRQETRKRNGFPLVSRADGDHVITDELVSAHRDE